eukprot:scaffold76412_cov31-Tisochrysis_lutea.AAC.3
MLHLLAMPWRSGAGAQCDAASATEKSKRRLRTLGAGPGAFSIELIAWKDISLCTLARSGPLVPLHINVGEARRNSAASLVGSCAPGGYEPSVLLTHSTACPHRSIHRLSTPVQGGAIRPQLEEAQTT